MYASGRLLAALKAASPSAVASAKAANAGAALQREREREERDKLTDPASYAPFWMNPL